MKKMLAMAVVLSASLLSLCACSSTDPPADPGEAPLQSWYKTDAYTLLLPQGFTAQEGEDGGVTLSLDGQAVGGVQVVPYPNAAGFLDTVGAASEDSRDSGKELMRQLSPEERLAYMMTVSEDGTYLEISCSPDTPDVTPEEETMHYLFPQGDQFYDLYFQPSQIPQDRQALLAGIWDGTIDMIVTDHAPHSQAEKSLGLEKSLMGVVGLETALPVMYTGLVKTGVLSMEKLVELMCIAPRRRFGLPMPQADYCVWDMSSPYPIDPEEFQSMGRATPFAGEQVFGRCKATIMGGKLVWLEK